MLCAYAGSGFGLVGEGNNTHTRTRTQNEESGQAVSESRFKKIESVWQRGEEKGCPSMFVCWNG